MTKFNVGDKVSFRFEGTQEIGELVALMPSKIWRILRLTPGNEEKYIYLYPDFINLVETLTEFPIGSSWSHVDIPQSEYKVIGCTSVFVWLNTVDDNPITVPLNKFKEQYTPFKPISTTFNKWIILDNNSAKNSVVSSEPNITMCKDGAIKLQFTDGCVVSAELITQKPIKGKKPSAWLVEIKQQDPYNKGTNNWDKSIKIMIDKSDLYEAIAIDKQNGIDSDINSAKWIPLYK